MISFIQILVLLAVLSACFSALVRRENWIRFSEQHILRSRVILFFLSLFLSFYLWEVSPALLKFMPGKAAMESPELAATAIKLGMYGLYVEHEVSSRLSPEQLDLKKCVEALSRARVKNYTDSCGNDLACFDHVPVVTKDELVAQIKKAQASGSGYIYDKCKNVDKTGL